MELKAYGRVITYPESHLVMPWRETVLNFYKENT